MQARTERRLGFVAASLLTAAAFVMPAATTHLAWAEQVEPHQIKIASAATNQDALVQFELDRTHHSSLSHIE